MKLTKVIISVLFLVLFLNILGAQQANAKPTFYFDEDLNQIEKVDFVAKSLTPVYSEKKIEKDSILIKKLVANYYFGQFNLVELEQLQDLIKKEIGIVEFDETLILVYRDTLSGFFNKKNKKRLLDADIPEGFTKDYYIERKKSYDSEQKKCRRFAKRNNAVPLHLFSVKVKYDFSPKNYDEFQISNLLKNIFFKNQSYGNIILKPNGQYFFYKYLNELLLEKMLKSEWSTYIKDLNTFKIKPKKRNPLIVTEMYELAKKYGKESAEKALEEKRRNVEREARYKTKTGIKKYRINIRTPHCYSHAHY